MGTADTLWFLDQSRPRQLGIDPPIHRARYRVLGSFGSGVRVRAVGHLTFDWPQVHASDTPAVSGHWSPGPTGLALFRRRQSGGARELRAVAMIDSNRCTAAVLGRGSCGDKVSLSVPLRVVGERPEADAYERPFAG